MFTEFYFPIFLNNSMATIGTYRLHFTVSNSTILNDLPNFIKDNPKHLSILGKSADILESKKTADLKYILTVKLNENPIPILGLIAGVVIVLGVGLLFLTFDKAEKLVENPIIAVGGFLLIIVILILVIKKLRR